MSDVMLSVTVFQSLAAVVVVGLMAFSALRGVQSDRLGG
jgi:hypothetical protein